MFRGFPNKTPALRVLAPPTLQEQQSWSPPKNSRASSKTLLGKRPPHGLWLGKVKAAFRRAEPSRPKEKKQDVETPTKRFYAQSDRASALCREVYVVGRRLSLRTARQLAHECRTETPGMYLLAQSQVRGWNVLEIGKKAN